MDGLKFRVWDEQQEMMFSVSEISFRQGGIYFYGPGVGEGWCWSDMPNVIKTCTLMQATGMKDKNGKDIYEGDFVIVSGKRRFSVVRMPNHGCYGFLSAINGRVEFITPGTTGQDTWDESDGFRYHNIEIDGNIYEDQLIKGSAKC